MFEKLFWELISAQECPEECLPLSPKASLSH